MKQIEWLVLLWLLSRARSSGKWTAPPGEEPLPVVPLPPNPLQR